MRENRLLLVLAAGMGSRSAMRRNQAIRLMGWGGGATGGAEEAAVATARTDERVSEL